MVREIEFDQTIYYTVNKLLIYQSGNRDKPRVLVFFYNNDCTEKLK